MRAPIIKLEYCNDNAGQYFRVGYKSTRLGSTVRLNEIAYHGCLALLVVVAMVYKCYDRDSVL